MKIQLSIIALAVAALSALPTRASAQAPPSDTLTITLNPNSPPPTQSFEGVYNFSEINEPAVTVLFTSVAATTANGFEIFPATLNARAGLTVLVEPGVNFDATIAATLTFADLFNATALARAGLTFNDLSDIIGIVRDTSVTDALTGITTNTVAFGVINDGDPGLLGTLGLPPTNSLLRFFTEGAAGQNEFITAALNVTGGRHPGPVYSATFVSDVEPPAPVPESGATLSLLVLGLAGVEFLRRKLAVV